MAEYLQRANLPSTNPLFVYDWMAIASQGPNVLGTTRMIDNLYDKDGNLISGSGFTPSTGDIDITSIDDVNITGGNDINLTAGDSILHSTNGLPRFEVDNTGRLTALTANYETLVDNDDVIPNKKYVDDAVSGAVDATTASNVGVGGVGLFKQKTLDDLEFRNINTASTKLSVVLDAVNNEVDLDVVPSNINLADLGTKVLDNLTDVNAPAPTNGQVLKYATVPGEWQAQNENTDVTTASNVGVGGVGLFKQKTLDDLEFRNINTASTKLSVVLDAVNNEVDLDVVPSNINLADLGTKVLDNLTDVTITAPLATNVLVRNVGNTQWVNDLVDYNTQIKNRPANRGYFDYAGSLTTAFPAAYAAGNTAYPPVGAHTASKIYINTTEKVVFFSNQTNPTFTQSGAGGVGLGANALTAYITANIGYTGVIIPTTGSQNPPVNIKFIGSAPSATQEEPVRMVVFRVANTRSAIAGGMPTSGTIATTNGVYGGTVMTDSSWSWFKYEKYNLTAPLTIWPDILTSWTRWWFSADGQDNYAQMMNIEDQGNVIITGPTDGQVLSYSSGNWINQSISSILSYAEVYMFNNAVATTTNLNTPVKVAGTTSLNVASSNINTATTNRLQYTGTITKLFRVAYSITNSTGSNDRYHRVMIYKGGVRVDSSTNILWAKDNVDGADSTAGFCMVSLATNEYVEVWVENLENNDTLTAIYMNLNMVQL